MGLSIPYAGLTMGVRWVATKGSGKSIGLGRRFCIDIFDHKRPLVVLDPVGQTIDNFLDVLVRRPKEEQEAIAERIVYLDMGATFGHAPGFPIYFRKPGDSLYMAANRVLEVWRRSDPALGSAPIQGLNAILNTGRMVGMICAALDWRITEVEALLREPKTFTGKLTALAREEPDVKPAVDWLLGEYANLSAQEKRNQTNSYLNKIRALTLDPPTRAIYGTDRPAIDWQEVSDRTLAVMVDFRGLTDTEQLRFGLLWVFYDLYEYIRQRPTDSPLLSLVIDELGHFLTAEQHQQDAVAKDFAALGAVWARNRKVALIVSHQEINQLSKSMHNVLMAMGTQVIGSTSDLDAAETLARRFDRFNPHKTKHWRAVWAHGPFKSAVIDEEPVFESMQEQTRVAAQKFIELEPFCFYGAASPREGELGTKLEYFEIVPDGFIQPDKVTVVRKRMAARCGRPVQTVNAEIAGRLIEDDEEPQGPPQRGKLT